MSPQYNIRRRSHDRGNSLVAVLLIVTTCAAVSGAVVAPSLARHSAARQDTERETALNLAQSGLDWGLASLRRQGGTLDADFEESLTFTGMGAVEIQYVRGDGNGTDDDGDGTTDEAGEARFTEIRAIGVVGGTRRGARVIVMGPTAAGTPEAAILLNVSTPVAAIRGNAFVIDGRDHDADGNSIAGAAPVPALGTGGSVAALVDQLPAMLHDQIIGSGGSPSVEERPLQDMDALVSAAMAGGYEDIAPGTYPGQTLGLDSPAGVTPVTRCDGDLHLAGTSGGAGTLVVEGDLHISGDFTWTGTILVRGQLKLTGGGKSKRLLGAVVVGDGIAGSAFAATDVLSMTTMEIGELDAESQATYDQMVASESGFVWDPEKGEYIDIKWDCSDPGHPHNPGNLQPAQLTEQVWVEETTWVHVMDDDDGGYYTTTGHWETKLVQGANPVLELSGNVEILFSRELALAAASTAAPQMDILVWTEFGVN